jgi:hypothetical protein
MTDGGYNYFESDEYKRKKAEMAPAEREYYERQEALAREYERQLNAPIITRDLVRTTEPLPVPERSDRSRRMKGIEPPQIRQSRLNRVSWQTPSRESGALPQRCAPSRVPIGA